MSETILLAEDDDMQRLMLTKLLTKELPYEVISVGDGVEALEQFRGQDNIKVVILDLEMPKLDGIETLKQMQEIRPNIPVIMLTASDSIGDAVKAMKYGAIDFINKPPRPEHLKVVVFNAIKMQSLESEVHRLKRSVEGNTRFEDIIGYDNGLANTLEFARRASASDIPVFLSGETGVGKELFARAIHGESDRSGANFIAVNCGAIPKELVESTLFGHEKGAFTGAVAKSMGKFREAEGGTIFLDELGELPMDAQVKLLRVLQQHEVEPVGAGKAVPVNVRVISATNRDLQQEVAKGSFREDLYFRLHVFPIHIPPLRERLCDVRALASHFMASFSAIDKLPMKQFSEEALEYIEIQDWVGNIRALQNVIRRAMLLSDHDVLVPEDLYPHTSESLDASAELKLPVEFQLSMVNAEGSFLTLEEMEAEAMRKVLSFYEQNITKASLALGMAKSTFYKKMAKYDISKAV